MESYVDEKYKESLKNSGRLGELMDVDTIAAIDLLVQRGQWEKALETARQKGVSTSNKELLYLNQTTGVNNFFLESFITG